MAVFARCTSICGLSRGCRASTGVRVPCRAVTHNSPRLRCSVQTSAHSGQADDLAEWVCTNGGSVKNVAVAREGSQGLGLMAVKACSKDDVLISLPAACQLTYDRHSDLQLLPLIDRVPSELWGAKLALKLLAERLIGDSSHFAPYIRNLPIGIEGVPVFFSGPTIAALQYPPVIEQVKRRCRWLATFASQELAPSAGSHPLCGQVDANALGWAFASVTSRAFRIYGPERPAALLPLIDMANHSFQPNAKVRPAAGGAMEVVCLHNVAAGEAIVLCYGNLPNDFLLLDYGFLVDNNPYDHVQLRFDMDLIELANNQIGRASTQLRPDQQKLLTALRLVGPNSNAEVAYGRGDKLVDSRLLTAVRVLCTSSAEELRGYQLSQLAELRKRSVAAESEVAARKVLSSMASLVLSTFSTSAAEDAQLLQEPDQLSGDMQMAIRFRLGKKQILMNAARQLMAFT